MKKNIYFIILTILLFILVLFGALSLYYKFQRSNDIPFYKDDCNIKCESEKLIPCTTNKDCQTESMKNFCNIEEVVFINGLTGYCKENYCQSYGCDGAPSID